MRYGVVNVQQIEFVILRHFRHAGGQGEIVRRVLEQRVVGDGYLVVENAFFTPAKPEGPRIGDEVDLVASGGKLNSQFGCYYAAAAVGGVTGDPDFHFVPRTVVPLQSRD